MACLRAVFVGTLILSCGVTISSSETSNNSLLGELACKKAFLDEKASVDDARCQLLQFVGRSELSNTTARDAEDQLQASRTAHTILSRPPRRLGLARHSWRRWGIKCTEATRRPDADAAALKRSSRPTKHDVGHGQPVGQGGRRRAAARQPP